ncbi:putative DNA-binding domain-containing protein [Methylomarinum sp. Ch1-1]|uniref:DNA-binding domain-containing protein n=1 Tax=Methylomarinum roseum TaxID=3067653 RepID=A0AAU7NWH5_9GAMM|nr:putative DNA-binding domain-containing protein [Methylomarinum sp. Ch1-1]MDP4522597.1 putative DNA-binding domain-containing protein [Methylomarinum sp. Ch1-1]
MSSAQPKTDFKAKQAEFAAYIRDPANNPCPSDVKKQRMDTYRELFFNNVDSFLSSNFPVLKRILSNQQWFELSQDFFSKHVSRSPYFSEIPEEFLEYLQHERDNADDYPFLLELAHYEWVEMALSIAQEHVAPADETFIDTLLQQNIALSPLAWPLVYRYPVQKISPDYLPETAPEQPTYLLVYRDSVDEVHFIQINAMTFRLLQMIQQHDGINTAACLQQLATEAAQPNQQIIIEGGLTILQDMASKGIVIPERE